MSSGERLVPWKQNLKKSSKLISVVILYLHAFIGQCRKNKLVSEHYFFSFIKYVIFDLEVTNTHYDFCQATWGSSDDSIWCSPSACPEVFTC